MLKNVSEYCELFDNISRKFTTINIFYKYTENGTKKIGNVFRSVIFKYSIL